MALRGCAGCGYDNPRRHMFFPLTPKGKPESLKVCSVCCDLTQERLAAKIKRRRRKKHSRKK